MSCVSFFSDANYVFSGLNIVQFQFLF